MPIFLPPKTIVAGSNISVSDTSTSATVSVANVGSPNGIASLDGGGKVPITQLPSSIMEYKGTWNASTNSPTLADGTGDNGDTYRVSVSGTQNLGSGSITFDVGDYCIYNGTIWEKSDTTDAVASVNSLTGNVVLTTANINDSTDRRYVTDAQRTVLTNTSGTNTGDQLAFSTVAVSGQSNVVADTTSDTLTFVAGTNITITTNATADSVTIAATGGAVSPSISDGRLTVNSSVSLPQGGSSVTHANLAPDVDTDNSTATLYYTPYVGNQIAMYDGTNWSLQVIPSITSMSLTGAGPNETFDVFGWMNGSTFNIERLSWGTNTAYNISAVTVGANTVITFTEPGGTQPFAVGDVVEIQNTNGTAGAVLHGAWGVTAVGGSGTSRTVTLGYVITTSLTYTGSGTIRKTKNTRATALAVQDGVYVKNGDATRKYLGTFRTTGANPTVTIDNRQKRFVWNYYNRRPRSLFRTETTSTWFFAGDFRAANANAANRVEFVTGMNEDPIKIDMTGCFRGPVPTSSGVIFQSTQNIGIGVNRSDFNSLPLTGLNFLMQMNRVLGDSWVAPNFATMNTGFEGYNFLTWVEYAWTNQTGLTVEIFGFSTGVRASGIIGTMYG